MNTIGYYSFLLGKIFPTKEDREKAEECYSTVTEKVYVNKGLKAAAEKRLAAKLEAEAAVVEQAEAEKRLVVKAKLAEVNKRIKARRIAQRRLGALGRRSGYAVGDSQIINQIAGALALAQLKKR